MAFSVSVRPSVRNTVTIGKILRELTHAPQNFCNGENSAAHAQLCPRGFMVNSRIVLMCFGGTLILPKFYYINT